MSQKGQDNTPEIAESVVRSCSNCGGQREHKVTLELQTDDTRDNIQAENEEFAKQPYRILECVYCGESIKEEIA